jgi:hypothetical protein
MAMLVITRGYFKSFKSSETPRRVVVEEQHCAALLWCDPQQLSAILGRENKKQVTNQLIIYHENPL